MTWVTERVPREGRAPPKGIPLASPLHLRVDALSLSCENTRSAGRHVQELHLAACRKARPDPEALARRLFAWELRERGEAFYGAVATYKGVLGKQGLAVYRELAEAEWKKLPPLRPGDARSYDANRSRLTHIMERLAEASGDVEALVAIKARDLSSAYHYLAIAEIYLEAGQQDRALEWAEKGVRAFPKQTDSRLRIFLAHQYQARRRHAEAMDLIWASFTDRPWLETYRELKSFAGRSKDWTAWREKALGHLRELAGKERRPKGGSFVAGFGASSRLVEILLWEKEVEPAWHEAQRFGCSEPLWLDLALRREGSHPEDALPIYQRSVEPAVQAGNYEKATEHLKSIRGLMERMGQSREFAAYLGSVRVTYKRKRNFMKLLDGAGLV